MPTTRELVLAALHARLQPLAALTLRDEVLPERIPAAGLIILRDGQPGEPEVTLSPLRYHYQHRTELEVVVQAGPGRGPGSGSGLSWQAHRRPAQGRVPSAPEPARPAPKPILPSCRAPVANTYS